MSASVYQFAVENVVDYIGSEENRRALARVEPNMTMFIAAPVLAAAFMKGQDEVMSDMLTYGRKAAAKQEALANSVSGVSAETND